MIGPVTTRVMAVARNTFREAVRDRVLYLVAAFGLLVLVSGKIVGWVSVGEDIKIVRDVGLAAVSFFVGEDRDYCPALLILREPGGRTIYTTLARPVARWEFVIGKYLGLLGTVLVSAAAMAAVFLVYLVIVTAVAPGEGMSEAGVPSALGLPVFQSLFLTGCELVVVTALAVFFSSISTPILSAVFTSFAYVVGQFASDIAMFADMIGPQPGVEGGSRLGAFVLMVVYRVLPNLDMMNIRSGAAHGLAVSSGQVFWTLVYALAYAGFVLAAACVLFQRRNLP